MRSGLNGVMTLPSGPTTSPDDLRPVDLAAVREGRVGVDQLDRRDDVVALADARLVRLALEHRLAEGVHLPLVVGDDAGDLAREVDPGGRPEAVLPCPVGQPVRAEHARQLEEERVRRVAEAAVDVAQAEAGVVPVVEPRAAEGQVPARPDERGRGDLLVGQRARPRDQLVRRSRREVALDRLVRQRLVLVLDEAPEVLRGDAAREQVVVVGRQADEGEHLARLRVHDDEHAALEPGGPHPPLEGGGRLLLDRLVDRQRERGAGNGLLERPEDLDVAAGRVALHELLAVGAAERRLERCLDARLADDVVG